MARVMARVTARAFGTSPALALIETRSIASGLVLTDKVVKKAPVTILSSTPVSSGKHVLVFFGGVAEVQESFKEAVELGADDILQKILIPNVHPRLEPFLGAFTQADGVVRTAPAESSLGIVESATLGAAIVACDAALKAADVDLVRLRLGHGIGGKAFFVIHGDLEAVEAAIEAADHELTVLQSRVRIEKIARPMPEALEFL